MQSRLDALSNSPRGRGTEEFIRGPGFVRPVEAGLLGKHSDRMAFTLRRLGFWQLGAANAQHQHLAADLVANVAGQPRYSHNNRTWSSGRSLAGRSKLALTR